MATTRARPQESQAPRPPARRAPQWRERLIPKTAMGMSMMILSAAVGAAFSGAVLYAYYEYRLNQNEDLLAAYDDSFARAQETIRVEREQAKAEVRKELEPLRQLQAEGETLAALIKKTQDSAWFVTTLDEAGQPSVGTAFAVASDDDQTLMLTSYSVVRAATRQPGPEVKIRKGDQELKASLWTWQEDRDLALLVVSKGNIPKLEAAPPDPPVKVGERVFVLSGLGAAGGSISQGLVADVSGAGIQHTVPVGAHFQGGPMVNSKGEVLAVASRAYAPLGFATEDVLFAIPILAACDRVLKCPEGDIRGAGDRR